jgi:hypothetical protein
VTRLGAADMQRNLSQERLSERARPHRKHISVIEGAKSTRRYALLDVAS